MAERNFQESLDEGRVGELYAQKHCDELVTARVLSVEDKFLEKTTGMDFTAFVIKDNVQCNQNVEVKTIRNFITRTNDNQETTGTIGFELYSVNLKQHGWLPKMLNPKGRKAVCPDIFIFLLVAYESVFASISFENVPALFERLRTYADNSEIDLDNLPLGNAAEQLSQQQPEIINNMWMVPLRILEDLATVTMIGDKPRIRPDILSGENKESRICLASTQEHRYEHLIELSGNRTHLDTDSEFEFIGDAAERVIATVDYNLKVLGTKDLNQHLIFQYFAKKSKFLYCYEGILMNMLSHEYPSKKMKGTAYYPMSYESIASWCRKNGYAAALSVWLGHIKYMLDFGLLKYSRPPKSSTDPVDIAINIRNPASKSVGYYTPIRLSRDVLMTADYEAQDYVYSHSTSSNVTKSDFIAAKGFEKVNPNYGNDNRKISRAEEYVRECIINLIIEEIDKNAYVTVEHLFNRVINRVKRNQKLKNIEPGNIRTSEDKKEYVRQNQYYRAIKKYRKRIRKLVHDEIPYCVAHLISKKDRLWLDADIQDGTYIITYKSVPDVDFSKYIKAVEAEQREINAKRRAKRKEKKLNKAKE